MIKKPISPDSIRIPKDLRVKLLEKSSEMKVPKNRLIVAAIKEYLDESNYQAAA